MNLCKNMIVFIYILQTTMSRDLCMFWTSDGRNQIAIRFNHDLNRNEDSMQTLRDSIQVPCDLILIRFNFNDSIQ